MSRLVAGPYLGEFGWELCCWNPRIRALAASFDEVVVLAPERSRFLYEFADSFHGVNASPGSSDYLLGDLEEPVPLIPGDGWRVSPTRAMSRQELRALTDAHTAAVVESAKTWRRFGWEPAVHVPPVDVCFALRPAKLVRGQLVERKAWRPAAAAEVADRLAARGLRLAVVGGPENLTVPGALDLRGAPLERQVAALSLAGVAIGPSSGPLHLAQLCGSPVVTWYDASPEEQRASRARYERAWNPWRARLEYLEAVPAVAEVVRAALRLLEHGARRADAS